MGLESDAIQEIVSLAHDPVILQVDNRDHIAVPPGWTVREDYQATKFLQTITLQSVVDYILKAQAHDSEAETELLVHIENADSVAIISSLDRAQRRELILRATAMPGFDGLAEAGLPLKTWLAPDKMILGLLVVMEETPERDDLIAMLSHIKDGRVVETSDNGISQAVTVSSGVTLVGAKTLRSVVTLQPRWTFGELEQPEVDFVIRARPGEGDSLPAFSLSLADVTWRATTIGAIRDWLKAAGLKDTVILA